MKQYIFILLVVAISSTLVQEIAHTSEIHYAPIMIQEDQNIVETAIAPDQEYVLNSDSYLKSQQEQQILIARNYEQNLPANGDCVILYSECNFKGSSFKYCNTQNEILSFQLPVQSIYVPVGSSFEITDTVEGQHVNFIYSQNCMPYGLHIPEPTTNESQEDGWFEDVKESELYPLDNGDQTIPKLLFYDNEGNQISREDYQKMIEQDQKRTYEILTGQQIYDESYYQQSVSQETIQQDAEKEVEISNINVVQEETPQQDEALKTDP